MPGANAPNQCINVKVLGQDNSTLTFKIRKQTPLKKLMTAYCDKLDLNIKSVRFRFDGHAVVEEKTAASMEMEDGDTIEVYQQQSGGCFY